MQGAKVLGHQAQVWEALRKSTKDHWGSQVYCFKTQIKHALAYAEAAKVLISDTDLAAVVRQYEPIRNNFADLIKEIQQRIAHESQQPAAVYA